MDYGPYLMGTSNSPTPLGRAAAAKLPGNALDTIAPGSISPTKVSPSVSTPALAALPTAARGPSSSTTRCASPARGPLGIDHRLGGHQLQHPPRRPPAHHRRPPVQTADGPGWANPATGTFDDPRFVGPDGRRYGPLPRAWQHYRGIYRSGERTVIASPWGTPRFSKLTTSKRSRRNPSSSARLTWALLARPSRPRRQRRHHRRVFRLPRRHDGRRHRLRHIAHSRRGHAPAPRRAPREIRHRSRRARSRRRSCRPARPCAVHPRQPRPLARRYRNTRRAQRHQGRVCVGALHSPQSNPWRARLRPSGLDFTPDGQAALVCTWDGDVWRVSSPPKTPPPFRGDASPPVSFNHSVSKCAAPKSSSRAATNSSRCAISTATARPTSTKTSTATTRSLITSTNSRWACRPTPPANFTTRRAPATPARPSSRSTARS